MTDYNAPVKEMMFALNDVVGLDCLPQMDEFDRDDIAMILNSASQLARDVIGPLNSSGDQETSTLDNGIVTTPKGFKEAYAAYRDGGWNSVPFSEDFSGQGLPWALAFAVQEMWQAANMSFGLCPLLNQGAVDAILHHASENLQKTYLAKLISGEWTGTMNLTEPDAGSDLAAVKTKAERHDDGSYRIKGQKIYITYGEHDLADNIIHLVLARLPDAPEGVKGISLFVVPKFLVNDDGSLGDRNDVLCVSMEHKLGIHASPTCTMQFGDNDNAIGYLVGEENQGLKYMFTMMNNARLSVGLQGVAISERAYQHARHYAKDRKQGPAIDDKGGERVAIIKHPDVKRMLLTMKAYITAGRLMAYDAARSVDLANQGSQKAKEHVDLMTPIVKAWCTDFAQEVTSLGVQIHGGMGFVEETGAAQHYRDARILPIYEGTNGIQAMDLSFRKILMNKGVTAAAWINDAKEQAKTLPSSLSGYKQSIDEAINHLKRATDTLLSYGSEGALAKIAAINVPYLTGFGITAGAIMMIRSSTKAQEAIDNGETDPVYKSTINIARHYLTHILPQHHGHLDTVEHGVDSVLEFEE